MQFVTASVGYVQLVMCVKSWLFIGLEFQSFKPKGLKDLK